MIQFNNGMLASFWEKLTGDSQGITLIVLFVIGAAALITIITVAILLCVHCTLTLEYGDKTQKVRIGRYKAVKLPKPEKEGFNFTGWYFDRACSKAAEEMFQIRSNVTLFAGWEEVSKAQEIAEEEPENKEDELTLDEASEAETEEAVEVTETESEAEEQEIKSEPETVEKENDEEVSSQEDEDEEEAAEGDEIDNALVTLVTGAKVFVQYRRSFRARLIQADDETKDYYNQIRNELLSYIGIKERESWNYDSYNFGRQQFAKVNANRKSLILYLALSPDQVDEKYNFRDVSEKKRYKNVPVRYKITGARSLKYAMELIEETAAKFELDFARYGEDLHIPYEEREPLIKRKLIKVYAKRETGETVTEEQLETYIAEGAKVEKLSAYTVTDTVNVNEAEELISDATAKQLMAIAEEREVSVTAGKKSYVNLDTLSANYREEEVVDLKSLKEKGLIEKKASAYKVLARGSLNKALTIEANDFSLPAIKMIALTGGKVVRVKRK